MRALNRFFAVVSALSCIVSTSCVTSFDTGMRENARHQTVYDGPVVIPDAAVQAAIGKAAGAFRHDKPGFEQRAREVREAVGNNQALVEQLLYFVNRPDLLIRAELSGHAPLLFQRFVVAAGLEWRHVIETLTPYLASPEHAYRSFVFGRLLGGVDAGGTPESPERLEIWRGLAAHAEAVGEGISPVVVDSMYRFADPATTFALLMQTIPLPEPEWQEVAVSAEGAYDAVLQRAGGWVDDETAALARAYLDDLLDSRRFWVRRYAAELLRRFDFVRTPRLVRRARQDIDPLVRLAVDDEPRRMQEDRRLRSIDRMSRMGGLVTKRRFRLDAQGLVTTAGVMPADLDAPPGVPGRVVVGEYVDETRILRVLHYLDGERAAELAHLFPPHAGAVHVPENPYFDARYSLTFYYPDRGPLRIDLDRSLTRWYDGKWTGTVRDLRQVLRVTGTE